MLADHAERQHPARQAEAEAGAAQDEERKRAEPRPQRPEPQRQRDGPEHPAAPQPVGELAHRDQGHEVHDLRHGEETRDPGAVEAELPRPAQRDEELAHRRPAEGEQHADVQAIGRQETIDAKQAGRHAEHQHHRQVGGKKENDTFHFVLRERQTP